MVLFLRDKPRRFLRHTLQKNTSYSTMLNIAEVVPPPESVPINSRLQPIPIDHLLLVATDQTNSGTELCELGRTGIGWNSKAFRPFPGIFSPPHLHGLIPKSWREFRYGIAWIPRNSRSSVQLCFDVYEWEV